MKFTLHIDPPRVTQQEHRFGGFGRNGRAIVYDDARAKEARALIANAIKPYAPEKPARGAIALTVRRFFATKDKRKWGTWKVTRPDNDNMQKMFNDEMTRAGFWIDDAQIVVEHVEKYWAAEGHIDVTIFELTTEKE